VFLKTRSDKKEIMDLATEDFDQTAQAYRLIRYVNKYLFGTRVFLTHLEQHSRVWPANKTIHLLDVGAGGCDIPKAIVDWARNKKVPIAITALDISAFALHFARKEISGYPEILLCLGSIFDPPFQPGSFDYVISSMFFHHLSDAEIPRVLRSCDTLAARGIIINDLLRNIRAYLWIYFLSRFTKNRMFQNDAPLSVLRGFKKNEVEVLIRRSGLDYLSFHHHFGHRFAIAGEKL